MVRKRADTPGLHFDGPPPVLEALAPSQLEATIGTLVLDTGTTKGVTTIAPLAVQAARHGGLVRVAIEEGVGTIAPAESRRLRARLHLPGELEPGATYSSTWRLGNLNLSVEVLVESAVKTPSARRAG